MQDPLSPRSSIYLDPFTTPPAGYKQRSVWKSLLKALREFKGSEDKKNVPPSTLRLTERNLTEYFNPEYDPEWEIYSSTRKILMKKQEGVIRWMAGLP